MDPSEMDFAAHVANEEVDLNAGESTSAPLSFAPTSKRNQHESFNAKKRQAIHVPMV